MQIRTYAQPWDTVGIDLIGPFHETTTGYKYVLTVTYFFKFKGGAIIIWPKDAYLAEAYRQLNNNNHYKKLNYDPTDATDPTKTLAFNLHKSRIIDNLTHKFLTSDTQARTPQ